MNKYLTKIAEWARHPEFHGIMPAWKIKEDGYEPIKISQNHPDVKKAVDYIKHTNTERNKHLTKTAAKLNDVDKSFVAKIVGKERKEPGSFFKGLHETKSYKGYEMLHRQQAYGHEKIPGKHLGDSVKAIPRLTDEFSIRKNRVLSLAARLSAKRK